MANAQPKGHKGVGMEGFVATWYAPDRQRYR